MIDSPQKSIMVDSGKKRWHGFPTPLGCFCLLIFGFLAGGPAPAHALTFKIATYNLENLFDMHPDGTEYPDYQPGGAQGWCLAVMKAKVENMAAVLSDLNADIVGLQEVESKTALMLLREAMGRRGGAYPHAAIAEGASPVKCAVLSRFPILSREEILTGRDGDRAVLRVLIDIEGRPLILYVNHWKSKSGPESRRLAYGRVVSADLEGLAPGTDFLLLGDFNSDYDEFESFVNDGRLNDTHGVTGINHALKTIREGRLVDESMLTTPGGRGLLYNLWLEIPESRRWSVKYRGHKNSPDAILLPHSLYDGRGISYVDNSFEKFDPDYLFEDGQVYRWQRAENGRGRHLGKGYSDHLPVSAKFATAAFAWGRAASAPPSMAAACRIGDLYEMAEGPVHIRLKDAVVIYKHRKSAILKEPRGRAVYVYNVADKLMAGTAYDLTVTDLHRHYGNLEITGIGEIQAKGPVADVAGLFLTEEHLDFSDPAFQNEVVHEIRGVYKKGWFHYGDGRRIRLYVARTAAEPANLSALTLCRVRIGYHGHPEMILEDTGQMR